ncbi:MAG: host attachment protein [Oligoflexia bacterium]|nr:host attachment protein [Oligoflexia bacterium]
MNTWILVVSRAKAKIYETSSAKASPKLIQETQNPEGSMLEHNLVTDRAGSAAHFRGAQHSALRPQHDKHELAFEKFAHQLSKALEEAKRLKKFERLVLVAEPHALGVMRTALASHKQLSIDHEIPNDLIEASATEIQNRIAAL